MRTPVWEQSPGALAALLNGPGGQQLRRADLYTITLSGGAVLRYSAEDEAVTIDGDTWVLGPTFGRSRIRLSSGIEVSELSVTISDAAGTLVNGVPLIGHITAGGFDGARVELYRAYSAGPGQPWIGLIARFGGRVGAIDGGRHEKKLEIRSDVELLDVKIPANVYQPGCLNTLYDTACGVSRSAHQVTGSATGGSDAQRLSFSHAAGLAVDQIAVGSVRFISGANAGISRTVRSNTTSTITTLAAWPHPVVAGDAFVALPGCRKTIADCSGKFGALPRFRGQPYIPVAETVT